MGLRVLVEANLLTELADARAGVVKIVTSRAQRYSIALCSGFRV